MDFQRFPGHTKISEHLRQMFAENRLPHALLLLGPEGSGNLGLALAMAKFMHCENPDKSDSCGQCSSCIKHEKFIHPDLHFSFPITSTEKKPRLSADLLEPWRKITTETVFFNYGDWLEHIGEQGKQARINIKECREIIKKMGLKPFEAKHKIQLIWMAELLGKNGNSLLKLIEEPPANTYFLLIANDQDKILNTLLSRTQIVKVPHFNKAEVITHLERKFETDRTKAEEIAYLSDGNLRVAEVLSAQENDESYTELFRSWSGYSFRGNINQMLQYSQQIAGNSREFVRLFLDNGIKIIREAMMLHVDPAYQIKLPQVHQKYLENFAPHLNPERAFKLYSSMNDCQMKLERNANPKITLFDLSLKFKAVFEEQPN